MTETTKNAKTEITNIIADIGRPSKYKEVVA